MSRNIIVLVPGYTGSELENPKQKKQVWPLTNKEIEKYLRIRWFPLCGRRKRALKYLTNLIGDNTLQATKVPQIIKQNGKKIDSPYKKMAEYFEAEAHGQYDNILYQENVPLPKNDHNLFIQVPYDWRRTNAYVTDDGNSGQGSSVTLNQALTYIYKQLGDDINIYLVAHSMGGLVSRALLETENDENGKHIEKPWKNRLMGLFTLGTPHLGSPTALKAICGQFSKKFLLWTIVPGRLFQGLIDMPGYSGGYELLPYFKTYSGWNFVEYKQTWIGLYSEPAQRELKHSKYKLELTNLLKAVNLFSQLNYKGSTPKSYGINPLPYHCLYSSKFTDKIGEPGSTCYQFSLKKSGIKSEAQPNKGDSLVTPYSGSFGQNVKHDCKGSIPISIKGVDSQDFPGDNHFQLPADKRILEYIKNKINSRSSIVNVPSLSQK